ncbi:EpsG family protein [Shewanella mangrovisoli]|uniref:EpsG family protein n=1 Tax=Shewanella mangrovisoli TaxID=2864211 RepID=UPI0035B77647
MIVKKRFLHSFMLFLFLLPVLYFFINFDSAKNLDYDGYKDNYENVWNQFELGYSALEYAARLFNLSFENFWFLLICIELALIAMLYTNPYVFILAFPNLLFLSHGLLGTQVRFAIATLLCLVVFKFFFLKRRFYLYSIGTVLFHNGTIIFHFLSFFIKIMIDFRERIVYRKNFNNLSLFVFLLIAVSMLVNNILLVMGYYYYADPNSKHMVERSLSSIMYTSCLLFFVFSLLNSRHKPVPYAAMVYLGGMMLVLSLVFYKFSIISGRYNLVFMLVEPFIIYSYYKTIGYKNTVGFLSFLFLFIVAMSKLLVINLTI